MEDILEPRTSSHQKAARLSPHNAAQTLAIKLSHMTGAFKEDFLALFEHSAYGHDAEDFNSAAEKVMMDMTTEEKTGSNGKNLKQNASVAPNRERMLEAAMFSHLGDGMLVVDMNRKVYVINKRAKEMLGYGQNDKVSGCRYEKKLQLQDRNGDAISPERNPVETTFEQSKPSRTTFMDDIYCVRQNGEPFPISISASPVIINKKIEGVVIIFDDVTQEKKLDEIKSDFIYIASHQLRTPLTVSTLHTEMLLAGHGGDLTKEQREFLTEIHFYNKKMAQLLSVFMTVSKIELGTFVMQYKPTDLTLVMDDVLHELGTQIKNKKIKVTIEYGEGLPPMETDPEFIRIVFQNLLSNAVKYTPHDGAIAISIRRNRDRAAITITDTGCGIPQNEQSQVFTKLYRGTNTKNYRWDSNGLGLYIAKAIIDKCNGSIGFTSEEGKGTSFFVSVPLKAPAPRPLSPTEHMG